MLFGHLFVLGFLCVFPVVFLYWPSLFLSWLYEKYDSCLLRSSNYLPFAKTWIHFGFLRTVLLIFWVSSVVLFCFVCIRSVSYAQCCMYLDCPLFISYAVFSNVYRVLCISCPLHNYCCFIYFYLYQFSWIQGYGHLNSFLNTFS